MNPNGTAKPARGFSFSYPRNYPLPRLPFGRASSVQAPPPHGGGISGRGFRGSLFQSSGQNPNGRWEPINRVSALPVGPASKKRKAPSDQEEAHSSQTFDEDALADFTPLDADDDTDLEYDSGEDDDAALDVGDADEGFDPDDFFDDDDPEQLDPDNGHVLSASGWNPPVSLPSFLPVHSVGSTSFDGDPCDRDRQLKRRGGSPDVRAVPAAVSSGEQSAVATGGYKFY